jgi:hypothetical protein
MFVQAKNCDKTACLCSIFSNAISELSSNYSNSENEANLASGSMESSDLKMWIRSESNNSVPSWASSISLDSQSDEADKFMKKFVSILFKDSSSITLELKADFGNFARVKFNFRYFYFESNSSHVIFLVFPARRRPPMVCSFGQRSTL